MIVHEPAAVRCTVEPETVQLPVAANETGRPDDAVALTVKSGSPSVLFASAANVIVCDPFAIANVCDMSGAGAYVASPACEAVIVHEPAPVRWTTLPETVQLSVAENETGRPDEAVALTVKSASPYVLSNSASNVIVWPASRHRRRRRSSG